MPLKIAVLVSRHQAGKRKPVRRRQRDGYFWIFYEANHHYDTSNPGNP
jgi:hypothetical protein